MGDASAELALPLDEAPREPAAHGQTRPLAAERSYSGLVFVLFAGYLAFATALYVFRGFRFISPDRWAPFLFLAALALGRGRAFVRDWTPFVLLLFGYQYMRGIADGGVDLTASTAAHHGRIQVDWLVAADRWLSFGRIPSLWLQAHLYHPGDARWYDVFAGLIYLLHFVFPLVFAFILWVRVKDDYWRFTIALVAMCFFAFVVFLLLPTAPPWLANDWGIIQGLQRPSSQAYAALLPANRADNFNTFQIWTKASPNPVAAFPSLHSAFPWLVLLYGVKFFGRRALVFLLYNAGVWFSILYLGLHWAIDIVAGIAFATAIFLATEWVWPRLDLVAARFARTGLPAVGVGVTAGTRARTAAVWARLRGRARTRAGAEAGALALVLLLAGATFVFLLDRGRDLGVDSAMQFYPMFALLGEGLRAGELPRWNPHLFAGTPLLADPQSGWMYLPVMAIFSTFGLATAIQVYVAFNLVMMSVGAYLAARVMKLGLLASCVVAATYQLSGLMVQRSACCPAEAEVYAWIPLAFVGAALAVGAGGWRGRLPAIALAGFAGAQIVAAWSGQGAYYAGIAVGGFIAYRTLIDPARAVTGWRQRVVALLITGGPIALLALGLSAAALLPRLEFARVSNLANGYPWDGVRGGWRNLDSIAGHVLGRSSFSAGVVAFALALVGLALARRRYAAPYFALLIATAAALSWRGQTPVHDLLDAALPGFASMQQNRPERVMLVIYLPLALLVGMAVELLPARLARERRPLAVLLPPALLALWVLWLARATTWVGQPAILAACALLALLGAATLLPLPSLRRNAPRLMLALLLLDQVVAASTILAQSEQAGGIVAVDANRYFAASPAARFLMTLPGGEPFRFIGYDASPPWRDGDVLYRHQFTRPQTARLIVNNRGALLGLDDAQGSAFPMHVAVYDDLITAANGSGQDYHDGDFFASGVTSPILDLLNVRYLVVPLTAPAGRPDLLHLSQHMPTVYMDTRVRVVENPDALPRAWIVHAARSVGVGEAAPLLASGAVDPRAVALVEGTAPVLAPAGAAAADSATVVATGRSSEVIHATTEVGGLLVLSEIAYPAWTATIDGVRAPVLTVDHALRAVALPAGAHTIVFRYESGPLRTGIVISAASYAALAAVLVAAFVLWRRERAGRRGARRPRFKIGERRT